MSLALRDPRASTLRWTELMLLVMALVVTAWAALSLWLSTGRNRSMLVTGVLVLGGFYVFAHLGVRLWAPRADPLLLPLVALLNGLGVVMISRLDIESQLSAASAGHGSARVDAPFQLVWTALGIASFLLVLALVSDHTRLPRYTYSAGALGLLLLLLPAVPVLGTSINGARLWLRVGPFTVQPAEFAKITLIVFFASFLASKRDVLSLAGRRLGPVVLPRGRDLGPLLAAWAGSLAVLTVEHDLGLSVLFFGTFVAMLYLATERLGWILSAGALATVGLLMSFLLVHNVHNRIEVWLHPTRDPLGANYQPLQAIFGLGTGGFSGSGIGQGRPGIVPFAKTDFMVSTLGEELGVAGLMAILVLFALLVQRGLRAALQCTDTFGTLLAAGLSVALALQVFFIVGGVTGLIPLTGVTLPWMSYGGSSVLSNWILLALLARISHAAAADRLSAPNSTSTPTATRQALASALTTVVRRTGR